MPVMFEIVFLPQKYFTMSPTLFLHGLSVVARLEPREQQFASPYRFKFYIFFDKFCVYKHEKCEVDAPRENLPWGLRSLQVVVNTLPNWSQFHCSKSFRYAGKYH